MASIIIAIISRSLNFPALFRTSALLLAQLVAKFTRRLLANIVPILTSVWITESQFFTLSLSLRYYFP